MPAPPLAGCRTAAVATIVALAACAQPAPKPTPPPAPVASSTDEVPVADESPLDPKTWAEVPDKIGHMCPGPWFALKTPQKLQLGDHTFVVQGSAMKREGGAWKGPLVLGVLGAVKDAEEGTRANVKKAMKVFAKQGVDFVVVNGDIAESNEIRKTMRMLGEESRFPVFLHSGNIEWTTAFTDAWVDVSQQHPQLVNMNWIRDVDFGGVHLMSLPGWSVRRYVKEGACFYDDEDVMAMRPAIEAAQQAGDVVILTAHGPPRSHGKDAIDTADLSDGFQNVGDENLAKLIKETGVPFGLFSHILEAGGHATADLKSGAPLKMPMKSGSPKLYLNAGSASSFGWKMNDDSTSRGLAAVFRLDGDNATVSFLQLWR